jgi:hypothetical protein
VGPGGVLLHIWRLHCNCSGELWRNELHLGAEYAFLDREPVIAVRGGVWLDPDHRFRSISDDVEHRLLFQEGEDEIHFSLGLGLAFKSFQIDLAADFSDLVDTFSLSAIYSF